MPHPTDIPCPFCNAPKGHRCRKADRTARAHKGYWYLSAPHKTRVTALHKQARRKES